MKYRAWRLLFAAIAMFLTLASSPVSALDQLSTIPTQPPKTDGPFLVTGYSFQGHTLRYVQIANISSTAQTIDGWHLSTSWPGGVWTYSAAMAGVVAPGKKIIIADNTAVSGATFTFQVDPPQPNDVRISTISLIPPLTTNWNDAIASVSVSGSTPAAASAPLTYFFNRNISSSTGSYLSTFTAFVPDALFQLEVDPLYNRPSSTRLQLVELYPKSLSCAPGDSNPLCNDYVKLYNPSNDTVLLSDYRIRSGAAGQSATSSNTTYLPELVLPPQSYVTFPIGLTDSGAWAWLEDRYGIAIYDETLTSYPSASGKDGTAWSLNSGTGQFQWTRFPTPGNEQNKFSEMGSNQCVGLKLSEIAANYTTQFIEVYNELSEPIDISGCQLQTNRSQSASYVFAENTVLEAGAYKAVPVSDAGLSLTKTTSGTVYLLNSEGSSEVDSRGYENLDENTSLALVGGRWVQTFSVTPGSENSYQEYLPCQSGYIRSEETGRCNKIEVATALKSCGDNQYRSEETGRCRNLATLASTVTACAENQYRNPETNRCKLIASTVDEPKQCPAGQERNATTNRCRMIVSNAIPSADFPVQKTTDAANAVLGWWAFAGVGSLILGYGGWEWRYEISRFFRKLIASVAKT